GSTARGADSADPASPRRTAGTPPPRTRRNYSRPRSGAAAGRTDDRGSSADRSSQPTSCLAVASSSFPLPCSETTLPTIQDRSDSDLHHGLLARRQGEHPPSYQVQRDKLARPQCRERYRPPPLLASSQGIRSRPHHDTS